jgi:hypothetical protein
MSQIELFSRMMARTSWVGFWVQIVLAVVATIVLLFSAPSAFPSANSGTVNANPGAGAGLLFAVLSLVLLYFSTYQTFRATRFARRLLAPANLRPSRLDTIKRLRFGLLVNLGGLLLALLAAETITGNLFAKALQVQPNPLNIAAIDTNKLIQPLDIFVVLGNTHITFAHFVGLVVGLVLLDRLGRSGS